MSSEAKSPSLVFKETRTRSLVKAVVYRVISLTGTTLISWFITKDVKETLILTVVIQIFLIVLYYVSERAWNRISWGKKVTNG